jgi:hypothetical protein
MYNVYQHWDPLKVCIVGKSYPPEFYSFIANTRVRNVMERIAEETEEDYQKLIKLLESFGVEILRPDINENFNFYKRKGKFIAPPMTPCDHSIMIGNTFYYNWDTKEYLKIKIYNEIKANHWPIVNSIDHYTSLPENIRLEVESIINFEDGGLTSDFYAYQNILDYLKEKQIPLEKIGYPYFSRAMTTRIGKDLYFGTEKNNTADEQRILKDTYSSLFPDYRCHVVNTIGHSDGSFCPVVPGLIVSLLDMPNYQESFPDWEVIYLPGQSWSKVRHFLRLKEKNRGKWWVPGEELNDDFTEFVESWLSHWVGYVEETVFDVNMLVIDEKNVVCNNYNKDVFAAFDRYGITPHVINFRHRYFWDGGLHCITSDLHRESILKDYFPGRN